MCRSIITIMSPQRQGSIMGSSSFHTELCEATPPPPPRAADQHSGRSISTTGRLMKSNHESTSRTMGGNGTSNTTGTCVNTW